MSQSLTYFSPKMFLKTANCWQTVTWGHFKAVGLLVDGLDHLQLGTAVLPTFVRLTH